MLSAIRESPTQRPCLAHDKTWRKKCTIENFIHFTARDEFEATYERNIDLPIMGMGVKSVAIAIDDEFKGCIY
ncbi:unnamed protein product [Spirodela intermedia]|uniref:Uncharacterized protein n=1 Tax=Spirodela intermedia TaxID=51605 RepID=A0A7I8KJ16_SPIIN|nr:unnamed protein product [Spirodela intermedia]